MQTDRVVVDILGTYSDGSFIANIQFEGKTFCAYYPSHMRNVLILHEYPDYVTRFVAFYENDSSLHPSCIRVLMREDLKLEDKSDTGLEELFRRAIDAAKAQEKMMPDKKDRIRGCLFGGAVGDALGYPVEFLTEFQIRSRYGEAGITAYELDSASGKALISDDTQMTLFTADGLLFGSTRGYLRGVGAPPSYYISMAYSDWLWTQENTFGQRPDISVSWLLDVPELYSRRAPGNTCLSALRARKVQSSVDRFMVPPINNSKGCGGVMRVAPLCVLRNGQAAHEAAEAAAITHGHPLGYIPAAILAHMIHCIIYEDSGIKKSLEQGISISERLFRNEPFFNEMVGLLDKAVKLADNGLSDLVNIRSLGEGWVAEEALAIAVYCSIRYKDSFSDGIIAAVNHNGDSDSTGAITGNILGALLGFDAIEAKWKNNLELSDVILEIANDLSNENPFLDDDTCELDWENKYVFCHRTTRNPE